MGINYRVLHINFIYKNKFCMGKISKILRLIKNWEKL